MDFRVATGVDVLFVTDEGIDQHPVEDLAALLDRDDGLVWVDVPVCDEAAARVLSEVFGFHPLAVRDCVERNAVPKVRAYRDHVFVVLHAPSWVAVATSTTSSWISSSALAMWSPSMGRSTRRSPRRPRCARPAGCGGRIEAGRLRPSSPFELSYAIVSALAQGQEAFVETVTRQVWPLEQRVTSGHLGDPEQFLEELFGTRHALLAVSNMATLGHQIYQRMSGWMPSRARWGGQESLSPGAPASWAVGGWSDFRPR